MNNLTLFNSVEQLLNWSADRNKITCDYGAKHKLRMSEIHLIEIVGKNPGIVQIQLSEKTGLTKGRISVLVSELVKKDMIIRKPDGINKKEIPLYLSNDGEIAFKNHEIKDKIIFNKMTEIMNCYSDEEREHFDEAIKKILKVLNQSME